MMFDPFIKMRTLYQIRSEPEAVRELADAFWGIVVSLFIVVSTASLLFGFFVFLTVVGALRGGDESDTSPTRRNAAFTSQELQSVLQALEERRERYDSFSNGAATTSKVSR